MYTQKIENIFDHIQDHSRLGLETDSWKTNQAEFFAFDKFTLQKSRQQIRGCINQPLYFLYITSEVKQY